MVETLNDVRILDQGERQKIMSELKRPGNERLLALYSLIAHTGLRISSALSLTIAHVYDFDTKQVLRKLALEKDYIKRKRKSIIFSLNSKDDKCRSHLQDYINLRLRANRRLMPTDFLFVTKKGTPLNRVNSNQLLWKICDRANVQRFSWHTIRRNYATDIYERSGNDLEFTRSVLGHKSTDVTSRYLGHSVDRLANINASI